MRSNDSGGAILKVKRLRPDAKLPKRATPGASGLDLFAWFPMFGEDGRPSPRSYVLHPGRRKVISTGVAVEIHAGFEGQVRSRSGLALELGITVLNSPGTIDSDYRGEVCVILNNTGLDPFTIIHGDRIAQLVIAPVVMCEPVEVEELGDTVRGDGGLGSTGVRG